MLTVALVVMVIFLFLRNVAATIIPSVAVPLSIVGTFGVMYLLGYSLNNLTLMALTISTGFVVDDAIVMIENISRYMEEGESPLQAALEGLRADWLHDRFSDRLADCRAHSAALHGRYRRPSVPRIRHHARGHDSGIGRRVADADADDVRETPAAQAGLAAEAGSTGLPNAPSIGSSIATVRLCSGCCGIRRLTLFVTAATLAATLVPFLYRAQGLFPGSGYRPDSGHFRSAAADFISAPWRSASSNWRKSFCKIRPSKAFPRSSASMGQTPP